MNCLLCKNPLKHADFIAGKRRLTHWLCDHHTEIYSDYLTGNLILYNIGLLNDNNYIFLRGSEQDNITKIIKADNKTVLVNTNWIPLNIYNLLEIPNLVNKLLKLKVFI